MGSAVNIALPTIGRRFDLDAVSQAWVMLSFSLAAAVFLVPFGKLADIHGRKRVFAYGTLLFTVSTFLVGISSSAAMLLAFRAVQGIGSAMIFGTGVAILTSVYQPGERGRVLGLNVAAVYLGLSLGPTLGGLLTQQLGWRSIFLVTVPFGLAALAYVVWGLKGEWAEAKGESFDLAGSAIYSVALVAVMLGFSRLPGLLGGGLILAGLIGIGLFAAWEMRVRSPVLDVALFSRNRVFAFSNLAALINYSATAAVGFLLSQYLQYIKGLTPLQAGLVLIAQPAIQALFSPLAGRLSDRIEPRVVASTGMAISAAGLFLLIWLGDTTPLAWIVFCLMLLGFGFALFSSPNMNAIMGSVERRLYGVASGTLATMRTVGQTFSAGVAALLFALYIGNVKIEPLYYPQFLASAKMAFAILTVFCVGGIFASLTRGKLRS
ncbi:MAG: MFS transporter [Anaerolineae bacterium]|nr:MFS transporter [Anaerolineae bacterium]